MTISYSCSKFRHTIATQCVDRMNAQSIKGKARDHAALEFVTGAAAAVATICGSQSVEWNQISIFALMVSIHGFKEVERFAADPARQLAV